MAGEPAEPVAGGGISPASAPEPAASASSPAAAAPAAAPVEPAPAPAADPAAQPDPGAAAPAAAAEPAAPAAPAPEPTLLQKHDAEAAAAAAPKPADPAKPAEPAKPAAAAPDPAKPADPAAAVAPEVPAAPVLEPVEYAYTLPETIQMDDTVRGAFHTALDAFRTDPTKGAQGLIDLHNQTMQQYAEHLSQEQHRIFNETRKAWRTEVMASEDLGGAGHQTAMGAVARMRDLLVPEADRAAFDQFLMVTGAGDHPSFLRLLHNAARLYDEAPLPPPDPRPAPNGGARPSGRLRDMYKSNQRG